MKQEQQLQLHALAPQYGIELTPVERGALVGLAQGIRPKDEDEEKVRRDIMFAEIRNAWEDPQVSPRHLVLHGLYGQLRGNR